MKTILYVFSVLALAITTSTAHATKARNAAMGNSFHLRGTQTVYSSPYHLSNIDNFVAIESGLTTTTSASNGAEGSASMSVGETGKFFVSIGHIDETIQPARSLLNAVGPFTFKAQQNPIEFIYSTKQDEKTIYGVGVFYSNFNNKTTGAEEKESSMGLRLGGSHDKFGWKVNTGLTNTAENITNKFKGNAYINLGLRYKQDNNSFGFDYTTWGAKVENVVGTTVQDHDFSNIVLRMVNSVKADGNEIFWGAGLNQVNLKDKVTDKKMNRLFLPVIVGFEAKATDWLMLRGSITQAVFLSNAKDERPYPAVSGITTPANGTLDLEYAGEPNTTSVAVGAGMKFQKVTIDGTLKDLMTSSGGQKLDGANILAQVGVVYMY